MPTTSTSSHHDVIVVGARCAGASTAMLLARHGLRRARRRPHLAARRHRVDPLTLPRWHRPVAALGTPRRRHRVRCTARAPRRVPRRRVLRDAPDQGRAGVDLTVAPRRHILDAILADAAVDAGAQLTVPVRVKGTTRDDSGRVTGIFGDSVNGPLELRARFVIGADGVRSRIARSVGAATLLSRSPAGATHYAYFAGPQWDAVEYFLGDRSFSGIFPTHDGEACVWVCLPAEDAAALRKSGEPREVTFDRMIRHASPMLAERLQDASRTSPMRGATGLPNHVLQASGPGWALVGDAGYHRDPITGHGITDAFRDAELLADAVHSALSGAAEDAVATAAYQNQRDRMMRPIFDLTCQLGRFPEPDRFIELQRALSETLDHEASELARRPLALTPVA